MEPARVALIEQALEAMNTVVDIRSRSPPELRDAP